MVYKKYLIMNLIFILIFVFTLCPLSKGDGNMFLNLTITGGSGGDNHGFESLPIAWGIANDGNKGCTNMYQSSNRSHTGKYSYKLMYNLNCTSPNTQGCIELDLTKTNLAGHILSVYIYCPTGSGGSVSAPNGIVIYAKDINWTWQDGGWNNIGSATNSWRYYSWTLPSNSWSSNIRILGLKIAVSGSCSLANWYQGPYYIDDFNW